MKKNEFMEFINQIDTDTIREIIASLPGSVEHGTISDFYKYVDDDYDTVEEKQAFLDLYGGDEKEMYMDFAKCYAKLVYYAIIEYAERTILSDEDDEPKEQEKTVDIWCRVSGTIRVPASLAQRIVDTGADWLGEFDKCPFTRDFSDDYVPDTLFDDIKRQLKDL